MSDCTYKSRRGHPLVYVGNPWHVPVLTVENYCKWYELYLVQPDGTVSSVGFDELEDHAGRGSPYVDHVPNPSAVESLAASRGWQMDEQAFEMINGRWHIEVTQST